MNNYPYIERFVAGIIDMLLLFLISSIFLVPAYVFAIIPFILEMVNLTESASYDNADGFLMSLLWFLFVLVVVFVLNIVVGIFWYAYRPSKNNGQTYGKSIMKVKIVKIDNSELTFKNLIVRYLSQIFLAQAISIFIYITIFMDDKKRAVYDFISNTTVVRA